MVWFSRDGSLIFSGKQDFKICVIDRALCFNAVVAKLKTCV